MTLKGISPVIASIILVLIVISLSSAYLVFTGRLTQQTTGEVEEQVSETRRLAATQFSIVGVNEQEVEVQNVGTQTLEPNTLRVKIDDQSVNYTQEAPIEPRESGTLTLQGLWRFGPGEHRLRVAGAAKSDSLTIRIEPVSEGRVLDLRFEEGYGLTTADFSGNKNTGSLGRGNVSRAPGWEVGKFGKGLKFDGVDDLVEVPKSVTTDFAGKSEVTVAAWIKALDWNGTNGIVDQEGQDTWILREEGGIVEFLIRDENGVHRQDCGFAQPALGEWHYIVGVFRRDSLFVYFDGNSVASPANDRECDIGQHTMMGGGSQGTLVGDNEVFGRAGDDRFFNGFIDEVLVYNRAYTPDELYVMKRA